MGGISFTDEVDIVQWIEECATSPSAKLRQFERNQDEIETPTKQHRIGFRTKKIPPSLSEIMARHKSSKCLRRNVIDGYEHGNVYLIVGSGVYPALKRHSPSRRRVKIEKLV